MQDYRTQEAKTLTPFGTYYMKWSDLIFTPRFQLQRPSDFLLEFLEDEKLAFESQRESGDNPFSSLQLDSPLDSYTRNKGNLDGDHNHFSSNTTIEERKVYYRETAKNVVRGLLNDLVTSNPDLEYFEDYEMVPTNNINVHGTVDFVLCVKDRFEDYHFPMAPIIIPRIKYNTLLDSLEFDVNPGPVAGAGFYLIQKKKNFMKGDK